MADASFDVIVIGAGAVGACTALELARSGLSVAIVESGEGWGGRLLVGERRDDRPQPCVAIR